MSPDLLISLLSLGIALIGGVGAVIQRDRALNRNITAGDLQVEKDMRVELQGVRIELQDAEKDLRNQINILNDRLSAVNERFVRRDDFTQHFERVERLIEQGAAEQRDTNKRIDLMLQLVAGQKVAA